MWLKCKNKVSVTRKIKIHIFEVMDKNLVNESFFDERWFCSKFYFIQTFACLGVFDVFSWFGFAIHTFYYVYLLKK